MVVNYEDGSAVSQGAMFRKADSNETAENYWGRRSDQLWGRTGEQSPVAGGLPKTGGGQNGVAQTKCDSDLLDRKIPASLIGK